MIRFVFMRIVYLCKIKAIIFFVILKKYKLVISLLSVIFPDMGLLQRIFVHNTKFEMGQVEDIVSNVKYCNLSQAEFQ